MKRTWIVVGLVAAALAGVLAWQLWPEDEPTVREQLSEVDGVTSVSGSRVWFPADTELSRLRSSVSELTELAERDETKIDVFVGEVLFHIDFSNFYGPADPQRAARIATAVESSRGELLEADLSDVATQVSIETPRLADVARVRRSVLDDVGRDRVHLRVFSDGTEIPRVLEHRPDVAVRLISRLRRAGATVGSVDAGLESVAIEAPTASVAERVQALMGSPSWPIEPKATVRLALAAEGAESSALVGDTASVLTATPMFVDLHRAGYRTALRGTATDRPRFVVETAYGDGEAVVDLSDPTAVRRLVSVLRAGDWRGAARFEIFGNRTVLLTFTSTSAGRARDVKEARATRSDGSDVELADELNRLVGRWNASAGS